MLRATRRQRCSISFQALNLQPYDVVALFYQFLVAPTLVPPVPLKSVGVQADKIASPARSNRIVGGKSNATLYGTTVRECCRAIVPQTRAQHTAHKSSAVQVNAGAGHREDEA